MPSPSPVRSARRRLGHPATAGLAAALLLSACGGGGSSDAPRELTLSGVVAVGAAVEGAAVSIQCAGEGGGAKVSASATSLRNGSFNKALPAAKLPCVLRASKGDLVLHSVAEAGDGLNATANITPLSEFISAQLAGAEARTLFDNFDAATQAKLSHDAVLKAIAAVGAIVKDAGVDLTDLDPIRSPLTAAHVDDKGVAQKGNDLDLKLDALGTALKAAGTSVAEMANAIPAHASTPDLARHLLKPSAPTCPGQRDGRYLVLGSEEETLRRVTLRLGRQTEGQAQADEDKDVWTLAATDEPCGFTLEEGRIEIYMDRSGLGVMRRPLSTGLALLVPEQTVPMAELAGTWNGLGHVGGGPLRPEYSKLTLDAAGKVIARDECLPGGTDLCEPWDAQVEYALKPRADGGFILADQDDKTALANHDAEVTHLFAFKAANGKVSLAGVHTNLRGTPFGVVVFSKAAALSLPMMDVLERAWEMTVSRSGHAALAHWEYETRRVDNNANAFTRFHPVNGLEETYSMNQPRAGLIHHPAFTHAVRGRTFNVPPTTAMPLPGTGLTISLAEESTDGSERAMYITLRKP